MPIKKIKDTIVKINRMIIKKMLGVAHMTRI